MTVTNAHLGELEETTGMPSYYVDEDYPAGPEIQYSNFYLNRGN